MKKLYSILFIFATLIAFTGCESDRDSNPTLNTLESFVLNTPPYVSGVYDLENTQTILLTCSQPDYGFTAATTYKVQIALTQDFKTPYTLSTTYNTAKMNVLANEFAIGVCTLMVDANGYDENTFPTTEMPVYVRLIANLGAVDAPATSNVITLPKVKPFFALPPMVQPKTMYITGSTIFGAGDWGKSCAMVPVNSSPGQFWTLQYFGTEGGESVDIKFNSVKDNVEGTPFGADAQVDEASKTLAGITTDGKLMVTKPGWYIALVTTEIVGRNYVFHLQFLAPNVYLFGSGSIGAVWEAKAENLFTAPNGLGEFVSPALENDATIDKDGLRICVQLPGIDWWKTEFVVRDGKLLYRGDGGDQKPRVSASAGQKVYINFTTSEGSVK